MEEGFEVLSLRAYPLCRTYLAESGREEGNEIYTFLQTADFNY
jgi:hypothetical protein